MNFTRIFLAGLGGFVAYFAIGSLSFALMPWLKTEVLKYPAVYRPEEEIKRTMPVGMSAMFVAILSLAVIYAMMYREGMGVATGAAFGALIGVFAVGSFVIHNYMILNIGLKLALEQSVAYFLEWVAVGVVIGLVYRPLPPH